MNYISESKIRAKKRNKRLIIKYNRLVEANYKMTLREQKVFLYMISMIEPDDSDFKTHSIHINELKDLINPKETKWGTIYGDFKQIIKSLKETVIEIVEKDQTHIVNLINDVSIVNNDGHITYEISPFLKPYLLRLKRNFTAYKYENIAYLRSGFSIRIYELLKQYQKLGRRTFKIEELKQILKLNDNQYRLYGDFKRRVILPAEKELKEKTDICLNFIEIRQKRKVMAVEFIIHTNENKEPITETTPKVLPEPNRNQTSIFEEDKNIAKIAKNSPNNEEIIQTITNIGITKKDAQNLLKYASEAFPDKDLAKYMQEKIQILTSKQKQNKIENPAGFLRTALKQNFKDPKTQQQEKRKQKIRLNNQRKQRKIVTEDQLYNLNKQWEKEKDTIIETIDKEHSGAIEKAIEEQKNKTFVSIDLKLSPIENLKDNPMLNALCSLTIQNQYPKYFKDINKKYKPQVESLKAELEELNNLIIPNL